MGRTLHLAAAAWVAHRHSQHRAARWLHRAGDAALDAAAQIGVAGARALALGQLHRRLDALDRDAAGPR